MYIKVSFEEDFNKLMMDLWSIYGKELFNIDGIGEQLDINKFAKEFFKDSATTADNSIDANSNVSEKNTIVFNNEFQKPYQRYNSYYLLWKEIKKLYGVNYANKIVENQLIGRYYINDHHDITRPYCFNFSTYDIAILGLPMVNKIKSMPPKHFFSFKSQIEQFTIIAANSTLGATGLSDFLITSSYYVKKILETKSDSHFKFNTEEDCWTYIEESLVSLIYILNQPNRSSQSCFTNISIFDDNFLDKLCDSYIFEDGKADKEITKKLQVLFLNCMNSVLKRTQATFPVTTACFSIDDNLNILDEEFLDLISQKNLDFGFINIYCGKTSTLSSCCFDGSQMTLSKSSNGINYLSFKDLYESSYDETKRNFVIFHNGSWCGGKIVKIKRNGKKLFKIVTSNNKEILVTDDHINPTINGDIKTKELTINDYLLFNSIELNSYPEKNLNLTWEQGVLIGAYLGDGSIYKNDVHFSLNKEKYNILLPILETAIKKWNINSKFCLSSEYNNVFPLRIASSDLVDIIKFWVVGDYCYNKEINIDCLIQSKDFRRGIIDGMYITDGGNSNRIYTTSKNLSNHLELILTSIGKHSIINVSDRRNEDVIIGNEKFNRNHVLYCIRWYDSKNKRNK